MPLTVTSQALVVALQKAFYDGNKRYDECVLSVIENPPPPVPGKTQAEVIEEKADDCLQIAAAEFALQAGAAITAHIMTGQVVTTVVTAGSAVAQAGTGTGTVI